MELKGSLPDSRLLNSVCFCLLLLSTFLNAVCLASNEGDRSDSGSHSSSSQQLEKSKQTSKSSEDQPQSNSRTMSMQPRQSANNNAQAGLSGTNLGGMGVAAPAFGPCFPLGCNFGTQFSHLVQDRVQFAEQAALNANNNGGFQNNGFGNNWSNNNNFGQNGQTIFINNNNNAVEGNNEVVSEEKTVGPFSGIELSGALHGFVSQETPTGKVRLEGESNLLQYVDVAVMQNGILSIGIRPNVALNTHSTIKGYISSDTLSELSASGASELKMMTSLSDSGSRKTSASASGSSKILIGKLSASSAFLDAAGASRISVDTGEVERLDGTVTGSSQILAFGLRIGTANFRATGASSIEANVLDLLNAEASGASQIRVKGNPAKEGRIQQTGSSRILIIEDS